MSRKESILFRKLQFKRRRSFEYTGRIVINKIAGEIISKTRETMTKIVTLTLLGSTYYTIN